MIPERNDSVQKGVLHMGSAKGTLKQAGGCLCDVEKEERYVGE